MQLPRTRRESEIWQACDDLWASGLTFSKLTGDIIATHLLELGYKKGSPNQIYQYRKTWAESRGVKEPSFEETAPTVLNDPISRAAALVREEILAEADEMVARIKEEAQHAIYAANQKYEQLQNEHASLADKYGQLLQEHQALKAEHFSLSNQLIQEQQQGAVNEERAQNTEQQLQQLREETQRRVDEQRHLYEQQLAYIKEENQSRTLYHSGEIESLRDRLEEQRQQSMVELDAQRVAYQKLERQYEHAVANERAAQQRVDELKQTIKRHEAEITLYKDDYKKLVIELQEKSKTVSTITIELKQAQFQAQEYKQQAIRYESDSAEIKQRTARLEEALKQLALSLERQIAIGKKHDAA